MDKNSSSLAHPKYRADIDGLRAIAVLMVVAYHAAPKSMKSGFVGVDVFFVISGYLISTILFESLAGNSFKFSEFYARRIRRIFPALIVVLGATLTLGWFLLLGHEYKQLGKHVSGAGLFSNLLLWKEEGYFDTAAESKPLLHLWSLGIEEQFYILWPLLLWGFWKLRFNRLFLILGLGIFSLLYNWARVATDPVGTFFLPHTRAWELLAGSLLAWVTLSRNHPKGSGRAHNFLSFVGLILIAFASKKIPEHAPYPGWWALAPVVGTVFVIAAGAEAWPNRKLLSNKVVVWFGLISYPLYLWHWPFLSFARIIETDVPSEGLRASIVGFSIFMAWVTYRFVELPIRHRKAGRSVTLFPLSLMCGVMLFGFWIYQSDGVSWRSLAKLGAKLSLARVDWQYVSTTLKEGKIEGLHVLEGQSKESVLFIGDSLMGQYYPRALKLYSPNRKPYYTTVFASRDHCKPLPLFEQISRPEMVSCADYYHAAMKLAQENIFTKVVLAGNWPNLKAENGLTKQGEIFIQDLSRIRNLKKEVFIVSQPPTNPRFEPQVLAREYRLGAKRLIDQYLSRKDLEDLKSLETLRFIAHSVGAQLINPYDDFCPDGLCPYVLDGDPLYVDAAHFRASYAAERAKFIDALVQER